MVMAMVMVMDMEENKHEMNHVYFYIIHESYSHSL